MTEDKSTAHIQEDGVAWLGHMTREEEEGQKMTQL